MNQTQISKSDVWQKHLQSQRESGLSQQAYCQQHGLKSHQFWYWKRKLEGPKRQSTKPSSSVFVPVSLASPVSNPGLSITLPNGISLSGIAEHNHHIVQQLMKVLK